MSRKRQPNKYDKPNGQCSKCGASLNAYMIGGYKLHDGKYAVEAAANWSNDELLEVIETVANMTRMLRECLVSRLSSDFSNDFSNDFSKNEETHG